MFNQIRRFKFYDGKFSRITCFPSIADFFLLQFNHFSSSATNATKPKSSFSAAYLENNFDLPPKRALVYSKHLKFDSPEKPLSTIAFLKNQEFTDSDISRVVKKWPNVFKFLPESLLPKIEFFRGLGLSSSELVEMLCVLPNLLESSLQGQIIPCVDFLRSFLGSDRDVLFSFMRYPGIFKVDLHKTLLPNVEILRGAGVPESNIAYLLKVSPKNIALDPERYRLIVQDALNLGLNPLTKSFVIISRFSSFSWKERIEYYTRWGWSEHQVLVAIRKYPDILTVSKNKITKIMDVIIKEMGCDVSIFMTRQNILEMNFERRIVPRCAFYRVLLSKGLVKKEDSSLAEMLTCTNILLYKKYVHRFGEKNPELSTLYEEIFGKLKWPNSFKFLPESLLPKIEFFRGLGLSSSELVNMHPYLLERSLEGQIIPCVDFLRSFLGSDRDVVFSIMLYPGIFKVNLHETLLPNVEILRGAGVPESNIAYLLKVRPKNIALDPERYRLIVQDALNLGLNPLTKSFVIISRFSSFSWKERIEYYTRWGWSEHQVLVAIRKYPDILTVSKNKITKIMDFIIKEMGCDVSIFMTRPNILGMNFEKRIVPRCAFYRVLLSKGLVKKEDSSLAELLACTNSLFYKKYVHRFGKKNPEVSTLYEEIFGKLKL